MSLYNILMKIHKIIRWDPCDIFYESHYKWRSYDDPLYIFGCKMEGTIDTTHTYTKLGQWFNNMPEIFHLLKLPYYIVMWPLWYILKFLWMLIGLFFPRKYAKCFD